MTPEDEHREKGQTEYTRETSEQSAQDCFCFPVSDMLAWSYCDIKVMTIISGLLLEIPQIEIHILEWNQTSKIPMKSVI